MNTLGLITALLLPAFLGFSWLHLFWRESHLAARIGYGYLLGIVAVTTLLRIWYNMGLPINFISIASFLSTLSLIPLAIGYRRTSNPRNRFHYAYLDAPWKKVVWGLLSAILVVRYGGILFEIIWRPLYPWDAWMNWAPKAKTWFELKELVPFVSGDDWIAESIQHNTYTLGNRRAPTYPPLVPLIQTWTALGISSWIDNLVNIPWIMCLIALALAFYGQARMIGAKPLATQFWMFLLLSVPYVNTHTALAGYADLWLAAYYCLAAMAFMNWALTKEVKQGLLMIIFAMACTQTKEPGIIWAATFLPAVILAASPERWRYALTVTALTVTAVMGTVVWVYAGGFSLELPYIGKFTVSPELITIPGLGKFIIEYHSVGSSFVSNNMTWGNWHLLGWAILVLFAPLFIRNIANQTMIAPSVLLLCGILFIVFVFFFTIHFNAALNSTTINRATVHILPVLLYYLMLSFVQNGKRLKTVII